MNNQNEYTGPKSKIQSTRCVCRCVFGVTLWLRYNYSKPLQKLVYVIGLHALQFGNNWMKKFRGQPKLEEAVVLLLINYIANEEIQLRKENYGNCL